MKTLLLSGTALALTASSAFAQDSGRNEADAPVGPKEIVVTAERRAQSVQDVPVSIVAISGDELRDRGISDMNDLQSAAPSLSFVDNGNTKFVNIRGVGITESAPNQTIGVAVHLDGTYVAREFQFNDAFFDVESIQVLRGPQGTYSGQNASGGAIFIVSNKPTLDTVSGYGEATIGEYGHRKVEAAVGGPVADWLGVRISGLIEDRDSFYTNLGPTGDPGPKGVTEHPGNLSRYTTRAQLLAEPSDRLEMRLIHQYSRFQTDGVPRQLGTQENYDNLYVIAYDDRAEQDTEYNRYTGTLSWEATDAFTVNANVTYQELSTLTRSDRDRTNDPEIRSAGFTDIDDEYWTGEVNLVSNSVGPFEWTVGATMLDYKQFAGVARFNNIDEINNYTGRYFQLNLFRKNQAVFGEVGYELLDGLQVKIGGRYNHEENGFFDSSYITNGGPDGAPGPSMGTPTQKFNNFTGRALVNWQPNPDHLIYATVSRGYKPGGITARLEEYDSEVVTNWEMGWKADLLGKAVQTSVSAFFMDYDGFQASVQPDPLDPTSRVTSNVDNTRIKGVEAQVGLNLGGLSADVAIAYLDTSYGNQLVTLPAGADGNDEPLGINLKGRRINFAPEFTLNAGIGYDFLVGQGTLTPSVRVSHTSSQWATFYQVPYHKMPARTLVDTRLIYKPTDQWKFSVYATNLFDETYINYRDNDTDGIGAFGLGAPRQIGASVGYSF